MALRNSDAVLSTLVTHTIGYAQEIPMARVAQATIPSGVKAYLRANLRDRFQAEILRYGPFSRVQPLSPSTPHLHELFFAHAAEGYVYPREEYLADLENAAHFTENYVCRPRWTLISFLFHDAAVISTTTLFTRLEYVTEYVYLPQLLRRMVTQKQLQEIGRDDCALLIRQIDSAVVREHTPRELALLARPIFDYFLYGAQPWELHIPLKPILLFFADKELHTVEDLIQSLSQSKSTDRISLAELADMCDDYLTSAPPSAKIGAVEPPASAPGVHEPAQDVSGTAGGGVGSPGLSLERTEDGGGEISAEDGAVWGPQPIAAEETDTSGGSDARIKSNDAGVQPPGAEERGTMSSSDSSMEKSADSGTPPDGVQETGTAERNEADLKTAATPAAEASGLKKPEDNGGMQAGVEHGADTWMHAAGTPEHAGTGMNGPEREVRVAPRAQWAGADEPEHAEVADTQASVPSQRSDGNATDIPSPVASAPDLFLESEGAPSQRSSTRTEGMDGAGNQATVGGESFAQETPSSNGGGESSEGDVATPGNGATTGQVLSGAGTRTAEPANRAAMGAAGSSTQNAAAVSVAPPEHQEAAGTGIPQIAEHVISGKSGGSALGQPRPATAGTPAMPARLNLERMITPEQRKRFVAVLCDRDADFYELVISRLNIMRTWSEAAAYIRELFEINSVDPWRDEAITFTDIVQQRFGTQGLPAV